MKLAVLIAAAITIAAPAMAQWNTTTMPLGNGWQAIQGNGPNGQSFTGTQMPMGNGWTNTQIHDGQGTTICTTMPMGNGFTSTQCN